jgi:catalase
VPGIDFSNDPLLAGRIHSYVDTQITRLGGPNFHEIPINAPVAQVHNNQRDGLHRQAIARGRVAYEPNSLAGGCPFQAGAAAGFSSFPQPVAGDKVRGKPEKFAEHYNQATLFWNSQSDVEKQHIIRAYRFELTRVQVSAVRRRVVAQLRNVAEELAQAVADGLGMTDLPDPLPKVLARAPRSEVESSAALSLFARPGTTGVQTRRVAILVVPGVDVEAAMAMHKALIEVQAVPRFVGITLGEIEADGMSLEVEISMEGAPAVLWDAVIVPGGDAAVAVLAESGHAREFLKNQYRHCKPMLFLGAADSLLDVTGISATLQSGEEDVGLMQFDDDEREAALSAFVGALAAHRHFARETDPPRI